jgi:hypothetical protein
MSIITTALGLILVYLILSLIVSAAQEVIASWMSLRAKHLKQALEKMLTNEKEEGKVLQLDKSLLERFENHTHFNNLSEVKPGKAGKASVSFLYECFYFCYYLFTCPGW